MKYYIQRQLNEYGPYTLADLQRYVAQGSISLSDMTRSEGMTEWTPVSQVIGNIPIPAPIHPGQVAATPGYGGGTVYAGGTNVYGAQGAMPAITTGPVPRFPLGPCPADRIFDLWPVLVGLVDCGRRVRKESEVRQQGSSLCDPGIRLQLRWQFHQRAHAGHEPW